MPKYYFQDLQTFLDKADQIIDLLTTANGYLEIIKDNTGLGFDNLDNINNCLEQIIDDGTDSVKATII